VKYYVIGDEDTVLGFGVVGVAGQSVSTEDEAAAAFEAAVAHEDTGIIIITEPCADLIRSRVNRYQFTMEFPLIVEIPDRRGRDPERPDLRELVNHAVGIQV
jgi:V/A-type H+/Na+-transporting ATPase subunit F